MLFVTYVNRGSSIDNSGGLLIVNEITGQVVAEVLAPPPHYLDDYDLLYHGKRGLGGIAYYNGLLYVASFDSILVFNPSLKLVHRITYPLFNGLHGICLAEEGGMWITSTGLDLVLRISFNGELEEMHFLGENRSLVDEPRQIDWNSDLRRPCFRETAVHANHVSAVDGEVYISMRKKGDIWALRKGCLVLKSLGLGTWYNLHDGKVCHRGEKLVICGNESDRGLFHYVEILNDLSWNKRTINLSAFGDQNPKQPICRGRSGWLRGLYIENDNQVFLGQATAKVVEVPLVHGKLSRIIPLGKGPTSSVVDIIRISDPIFVREIEKRLQRKT